MTTITATYSPDDNKLRLTASERLDAETYARVKAAGYAWAPKQGQFIAPMWTPARADLALDLAGEIGDEDTSLIERAEDRADRFTVYHEKRGAEAASAIDYVHKITDNIPLGQPLMVGHHSEARARRDAKRIERGMQRAVDLFDTSEYWQRRAAACVRHAKYKETPEVRHRRIKGLEADQRKHTKDMEAAQALARIWAKVPRVEWDKQTALATAIAGRFGGAGYDLYSRLKDGHMHGDTAWRSALVILESQADWAQRWLDHIGFRLDYERAMLAESGGIVAQFIDIQPGGRVLIAGEWCAVLRVNKSGGKIVSVTTTARYVSVRGIEEIKDYREPTAEDAAKVTKVTKQAPLCNYRTEGCKEMTTAEWKKASTITGSYYVDRIKATPEAVAHRRRTAHGGYSNNFARTPVFLTDAKESRPPVPAAEPAEPVAFSREIDPAALAPATHSLPREQHPQRAEAEAIRTALKAGVTTIAAPQLFPTPPALAARMVELADIKPGQRVMEPSAGTGRIVDAIAACVPLDSLTVDCIEVNGKLAQGLQARHPGAIVRAFDFLSFDPAPGSLFDAVLMNPPFASGQDVAHVTHAVRFLAPGGRLVAIMSAGVLFRSDRKTREFRELVETMGGCFDELPANTFEQSGTGVNTVLLVLDAPGEPPVRSGVDESEATTKEPLATPSGVVSSEQVAAIVQSTMAKRVHWTEAEDRHPTAAEVLKAAEGLEACAAVMAQQSPGDTLHAAYRAAAGQLRTLAPAGPAERAEALREVDAAADRYYEAWRDRHGAPEAVEGLAACRLPLATHS